jgi:hypothetical protein
MLGPGKQTENKLLIRVASVLGPILNTM